MLCFVIKAFSNCNSLSPVYNFTCFVTTLALLILNFGAGKYWPQGGEKNGQWAKKYPFGQNEVAFYSAFCTDVPPRL